MSVLQYNSSLTARRIKLALVVVLLGLAPISLVRMAQLTLRTKGSWDFYPFWRASQFIWQGTNPYEAMNRGDEPQPGSFIDRNEPVDIPSNVSSITLAPNLPPVLLYVLPFGLFSWESAKILWLISNAVLLVIASFGLVNLSLLKLLRIDKIDKILIILFFANTLTLKLALEAGQTVVLVFCCSVGALFFAQKSNLLAGFLLGIALSKYTVALPVALLFLFTLRFRALLIAVFTQGIGFVFLAVISNSPIIEVVWSYIDLIRNLFSTRIADIQLGFAVNLSNLFLPGSVYGGLSVILLSLVVLVSSIWVLWPKRLHLINQVVIEFHVLTILCLWSLLVVYHGDYDVLLYIFFFVLLLVGWNYPSLWSLSRWQSWLLAGVTATLAFTATSIYTRSFYFFFPDAPDITPRTMTISILVMLGISLWLTYRVTRGLLLQTAAPALSLQPDT